MAPNTHQSRLYLYGMILFLFGLLIGMASPLFKNPRLILSAHLEGVLNGIFLIVVGLVWDRVQLAPQKKRLAFQLLIFGGFTNWLACILGAAFGASRMTPIAGAGHSAELWQENLVSMMFGSVAFSMTLGVALLVWGLRASDRN